jgi:hypothetical protein
VPVTVRMLVGLITVGLVAELVFGAVQLAVGRGTRRRTPGPIPFAMRSPTPGDLRPSPTSHDAGTPRREEVDHHPGIGPGSSNSRGVPMAASRPAADTTQVAYNSGPAPTGWTGWVVFASFIMILVGTFQAIEGLVALFDDGFYAVKDNLVIEVDYNVWGWVHLILGIAIAAAGMGILAGNILARIVGVGLAGLSAIVNLVFIEAYPVWSVIIITVDVLVIYALTVHGRELRDA